MSAQTSRLLRASGLCALLLLAAACSDDGDGHDHDEPSAGSGSKADGGAEGDAGTAVPAGPLARPALPRPPKGGLPAELRPPR
jgi:hypothetical protein